ncbi:MAG: hypothetical protein AAFX95_19295 [Cyanobacteria bacterium J06639_16]
MANRSIAWHESRLAAILRAAAKAPGNRARFQSAGLIAPSLNPNTVELVPDWMQKFSALEPLSKATVRRNPGSFLAGVSNIVYRGSTSGSQDRAYIYFADQLWNQQRQWSREHFLSWWDIDQHTPIVTVASRLQPTRVGDMAIAGAINTTLIDRLMAVLSGDRPVALRGYPSRLVEVASLLVGKPLPAIAAVICTGELLFDQQQTLLERVFNAPVINEYGCQETGIFAMTCPEQGRLHLDDERCFYEVVGGHLVTTDLWNETMPLVRYQCGDTLILHEDACPCGRPSLTVTLLGRTDDRIQTTAGVIPVGSVAMPAIPGLLSYRVQHQTADSITAWVRPDPETPQFSPQPLEHWVKTTLGDLAVDLLIEEDAPRNEITEGIRWDSETWFRAVTQGQMGSRLAMNPLPHGDGQETARVLVELLNPAVIAVGALPPSTQALVDHLAQSPVIGNVAIEQMKNRVLLLASSCMADGDGPPGPVLNHRAQSLYDRAVERLGILGVPIPASIQTDLLIPTLHLPSTSVPAIWSRVMTLQASVQLDRLNVHHLLAAFEGALKVRSPQDRTPLARSLSPVLAVLVGDLTFWAPQFSYGILAHWVELMRGLELVEPIKQPQNFAQVWQNWRWSLHRARSDSAEWLTELKARARSPEEKTCCQIEQGYKAIASRHPLNPSTWLERIETHAQVPLSSLEQDKPSADLTPWMPIVRALVEPLYEDQQPELAYRCLVAASVASRQGSAFDRLTETVNRKQVVLAERIVGST